MPSIYNPQHLNWRQYLNPLRALSLWRIVTWLELSERGVFSSLQWFYRFMEKREPTLRAIKKRRLGAIDNLSWSIAIREDVLDESKELAKEKKRKVEAEKKVKDQAKAAEDQAAMMRGEMPKPQKPDEPNSPEDQADPDGLVETPRLTLAREQQKVLKDAYESIPNLRQAIRHLALAEFRGYAHLEKHYSTDGDVIRLEPVPQWNWARKVATKEWLYNRDALDANYGIEIDPLDFIIRTVDDPIDEALAPTFFRKNLGVKDWDGFQETFGIPSVFIELPEGSTVGDAERFQALCEKVISDMRGVLPGGAKVNTVDIAMRGKNPFGEHIGYQDEQIVLTGTGGKLTMLNDATGLGSGQSEVHSATFDAIAAADGKEISELLQEQFDAGILDREFPGKPHLAHFRLAPVEVVDANEVVTHAVQLKNAGYRISRHQLEEKTGYELEEQAAPAPMPFGGPGKPPFGGPGAGGKPPFGGAKPGGENGAGKPPMPTGRPNPFAKGAGAKPPVARNVAFNRAGGLNAYEAVGKAQGEALAGVRGRLGAILAAADPADRAAKLTRLKRELPSLLEEMNRRAATEQPLYEAMSAAFFDGITEGQRQTEEPSYA